ncbi:hypothetical protein LWI29_031152 [Acer saccharum]|uniref:Phosphoinositide phospholipase C n=1 Tax=Acer saccharum TaxID=4024 RepID=A0AA39W7E2_ACESA|nr:hypothetical protein LWI29_031152 [Acer saccharum]
MLYHPGTDCLEKFPSPESLKKRVLISTKPPVKFQNSKPSQNKEDPKTDQQGQVDNEEFIEEVDEEKAAPEYRNLIAIHAMKLKGRNKEKSSLVVILRLQRQQDNTNSSAFKFSISQVSEPPEDIKKLFQNYSKNDTMTVEDLLRFMKNFQKEENATTEQAQTIFNSLKHLFIFHRRGLHLDAFFRYLLGDHNLPISSNVHQDMTAPLAHYFLYTGHNSYLTGNQLSSDSSVDPIKQALRHGVRVIELDLWPNTKQNDVKVCHGGTLTSPVDLIKCLHAIKDNAFAASEYPVVITFEDHLTPILQEKVAQMVTKVFGDMLHQSGHLDEFPSPESLKKKVLISTKPPEEYPKAGDNKDMIAHSNCPSSLMRYCWIGLSQKGKLQKLKSSSKKDDPNIEESYSRNESAITDKDQLADKEYMEEVDEDKAAPEYRKLIAIHAMKLKGRLDKILRNIDPYKGSRLSMSEQQLENAVNNNLGADIVKFTQQNLLRVYPKGMRIDSSNYNPFVGWEHGAQMVAFNMQGTGQHLQTMQGMFRANGGCGYVKKPDLLLRRHLMDRSEYRSKVKKTLKVKIYLGEGWHYDFHRTHFDRCSPPDFFVKVAIEGVEAGTKEEKTEPVSDQWVPEWNQEFEFPLTVPELALLRIEVFDYDSGIDDFAGQTCLPVSELKSGIRAVPLHNREGDQYKYTRLLVRFQFD